MKTSDLLFLGGVFLALVVFGVLLARPFRAANRNRDERRRLLETGQPATAVVLETSEGGPYYSGVPHLDLRVRVTPASGSPFEASARGFFRLSELARFQPGATIEVRFEVADLSRVAIVGDRLV